MTRSDVSDAIAHKIDEAVRQIVQSCYTDTVKLVADHRACMDRLVELLIEKESLDGDEFRLIVSEFASIPDKDRFSPLLTAADLAAASHESAAVAETSEAP
jgi:cell division protease FtsH